MAKSTVGIAADVVKSKIRRRLLVIGAACAVIGALMFALPLLFIVMITGSDNAAAAGACNAGTPVGAVNYQGPSVQSLNAQQMNHAAAIVATGHQMGIPDKGIVVALATSYTESKFLVDANNGIGVLAPDQQGIVASLALPHDGVGHDHGSLGIFQQQWPWWGSMQQLMDPSASARLFYQALQKVPGWQNMPVTVAAQTVQRSAYPDAYAPWQALAEQILSTVNSGTVTPINATADAQTGANTATCLAGAQAPLGSNIHVGEFNYLACHETGGHSDEGKASWASCQQRWPYVKSYLLSKGYDFIGLQEIDAPQLTQLRSMGPDWGIYPNNASSWNQFVYNKHRWSLESGSIFAEPGPGHSTGTEMVAKMKATTGQEIWVMDLHHATPGGWSHAAYNQRLQTDLATEVAQLHQLEATGIPVVVLGDMNDWSTSTDCTLMKTGGNLTETAVGYRPGQDPCTKQIGMSTKILISPGLISSGSTVDWSVMGSYSPVNHPPYAYPFPITDIAVVSTDINFPGTASGGPVVFPLPSNSGYIDDHNYGARGDRWKSFHTGDDFSVACGTPVYAVTAGTIILQTGPGWAWAGNWLVQVQTEPGHLTTWYAHMQALTVTNGQHVTAGQQIGNVGALGNASGCHLHFEVHPQGGGYMVDQVNPDPWLTANLSKTPSNAGA